MTNWNDMTVSRATEKCVEYASAQGVKIKEGQVIATDDSGSIYARAACIRRQASCLCRINALPTDLTTWIMQLTALLSISLGVINIMPFPALDGGRFLFIIFEVILRRRPSAKWESTIHGVGFVLLMLLIVVITWNDIVQLIS